MFNKIIIFLFVLMQSTSAFSQQGEAESEKVDIISVVYSGDVNGRLLPSQK